MKERFLNRIGVNKLQSRNRT